MFTEHNHPIIEAGFLDEGQELGYAISSSPKRRDARLQCRGIRGAITVSANSRESILAATKKLLSRMVKANQIETTNIAAILFTTTRDIDAEFPAAATRELGWPSSLALLCGHEMNVPGALARCLRILMLVNTEKEPDEITHIYLGEARKLKDKPSPAVGGTT